MWVMLTHPGACVLVFQLLRQLLFLLLSPSLGLGAASWMKPRVRADNRPLSHQPAGPATPGPGPSAAHASAGGHEDIDFELSFLVHML